MKRDIISTPWSDLPISKGEGKNLGKNIRRSPLKYSLCDVRIRMGLFRTEEEEMERREKIRKKKLP